MNNIITFPVIDEWRQKCHFKNKPIQVEDEEGGLHKYPCIVLYEEETNIPIYYTGLERYICNLVRGTMLDEKTMDIRAYSICHFLNYILRNTNINYIHECDLMVIRMFLKSIKIKEDGTKYAKETWNRYKDYVMDFLINYYAYNKYILPFQYIGEELRTLSVVKDEKHHRKVKVVQNSALSVSSPKSTHKKNRVLVYGYLDLLMYTAKKYEPHIVLGIALGAYAGLREGEIVNLTCGSIKILRKSFGMISGIEIDLNDTAPFFQDRNQKTKPGAIKKHRTQKVYPDFISTMCNLYEDHIALMELQKLDTSTDAPLFVNKQKNPMTVQTYSSRVKALFYDRFLPSLKKSCELQGTYADNAAYIETYEEEYPGAHMFRHWFTMYLLTKAKLTQGEIMKWRGDSSPESMADYIHENSDFIEEYRNSAYIFQSQILEDM